jgi:apolipoprotein N-acyltransferase
MLPPFTQGVLEGTVEGRDGLTPYAAWAARAADWPWLVLALAVIVGVRLRPAQAAS